MSNEDETTKKEVSEIGGDMEEGQPKECIRKKAEYQRIYKQAELHRLQFDAKLYAASNFFVPLSDGGFIIPFSLSAILKLLSDLEVDLRWIEHVVQCKEIGVDSVSWKTFESKRDDKLRTPLLSTMYAFASCTVFLLSNIGSQNILAKQACYFMGQQLCADNEWRLTLASASAFFDSLWLLTISLMIVWHGTALERRHGTLKTALVLILSYVAVCLTAPWMPPSELAKGPFQILMSLVGIVCADFILNRKIVLLHLRECQLAGVTLALVLNSATVFWPFIPPTSQPTAEKCVNLVGPGFAFCLALRLLRPSTEFASYLVTPSYLHPTNTAFQRLLVKLIATAAIAVWLLSVVKRLWLW